MNLPGCCCCGPHRHTQIMINLLSLKLVKVLLLLRDTFGETLALAHRQDGFLALVAGFKRRSGHGLPVVERALREGLATRVGTEIGRETKGFHDWQVRQERHLGRTGSLLLREDVTTTTGQDTVDITHGILRHRNVTQVNGLEETGLGHHHGRKADTTTGRHDLSHTTVNGIGVKDNIHQVETAAAHLLVAERTVLGGPSETTDHGFLNLQQVVDSLGGVDEHVGAGSLGSKGPDLTGFRHIPAEIISERAALKSWRPLRP